MSILRNSSRIFIMIKILISLVSIKKFINKASLDIVDDFINSFIYKSSYLFPYTTSQFLIILYSFYINNNNLSNTLSFWF